MSIHTDKGMGPDEYVLTPAAAAIVDKYWPGPGRPGNSAAAQSVFQAKMDSMQHELINLYLPIMSREDKKRARQTLKHLRNRKYSTLAAMAWRPT